MKLASGLLIIVAGLILLSDVSASDKFRDLYKECKEFETFKECLKGDPGEPGKPGESVKGDKGEKGDPGETTIVHKSNFDEEKYNGLNALGMVNHPYNLSSTALQGSLSAGFAEGTGGQAISYGMGKKAGGVFVQGNVGVTSSGDNAAQVGVTWEF